MLGIPCIAQCNESVVRYDQGHRLLYQLLDASVLQDVADSMLLSACYCQHVIHQRINTTLKREALQRVS
jgi:hypothetical protein